MATIPYRCQRLIDIVCFLGVGHWLVRQTMQSIAENRLDFIEVVFIAHNLIFCLVFLLRHPAKAIQTRVSHQIVALVAFYSGMLFIGPASTDNALLLSLSRWTLLAGLIIGTICLIQLGKSFGVLIAVREVRTGGLYSLVRHPMYCSDIIMRTGYCFSHPAWGNLFLLCISTVCYMLRAILEESFIAEQDMHYASYRERVRYRFIPGVF
jgi:protein-S-isoprenylcysteine O-methyltransferase Ste14